MAGDLVPIEVLAPGTYTSTAGTPIAIGVEHLDAMVANHARLADYVKPPLKLGHGEQIIAGQDAGQPALGWVAKLARRGRKLIAYVADMPDIVKAAIKAGRYRRVSAEFLLDWGSTQWEQNLKTGVTGAVLDGVALLGADLPQVANLEDLTAYLAEHGDAAPRVALADGGETGSDRVTATLEHDGANRATLGAKGGMYDLQRRVNDALMARYPHGEAYCEEVQLAALGADMDCAIVNVAGSLMRYPFTLGEDGACRLGEPMPCQIDYVSASTAGGSSAQSRVVPTSNPEPKQEATMAEDLDALRAELTALREQFAAVKTADEAAQAKLAEEAAERAKLSAEVAQLRIERNAALNKAREQEAIAFAQKHSSGETMRVLPAQAGWLSALYQYLAAAGDTAVCAAVDAERMALSEPGKGRDLTALDLLHGFLAAGPDHKVLLAKMPRGNTQSVESADDYDTALATVASREKLNLSVPADKTKAVNMLATERPDLTGARFAVRED